MLKANPGRYILAILLLAAAAAGAVNADSRADHTQPAAPAAPGGQRYAAVARGRVAVEGGLLSLKAPVAGTVTAVATQAGDDVKKGQTLARLDDQEASARVRIARAKLSQAKSATRLLEARLNVARANAGTLKQAAQAGAGSQHDANTAEQKVQTLKWQLAGDRAQGTIAAGRLAIARHRQAEHRITAPVAGQILSVNVQPGDRTAPHGGPAFRLLPDRPRIIRAELNQEYVDHVHPGMTAQVVLDNAEQTVVGQAKVTRIGEVFHKPRLENDPALNAGTRTVLCVLHFTQPTRLRIGQLVLVRIHPRKAAKAARHGHPKGS